MFFFFGGGGGGGGWGVVCSNWLPLVRSLVVMVRNSSDARTLLEINECHHSLPSNVGSVRTWQGCEYSYTSYLLNPFNSQERSTLIILMHHQILKTRNKKMYGDQKVELKC